MSSTVTQTQASETKGKVCRLIADFRGATKLFALNWFYSLKAFGIPVEVCHLIAEDCQASLGLAMSKDSELAAKVGKANKAGEASFKLAGSTGDTKVSPSMSLVRIVQQLEETRTKLKKEGYSLPSREFNPDWLSFEPVQDYWKGLPGKVAAIQWFKSSEELNAAVETSKK